MAARQSSLELFILSCLDRGLETPYQLHRVAGLSLGATNPALKRLVKDGHLKRSTPSSRTKRPRHAYSLTETGRAAARNDWKQFIESPSVPTDSDSLLRILDLAIYYKHSRSRIVAWLKTEMTARQDAVEVLAIVGRQPAGGTSKWHIPWLRKELEKARLMAEIDALRTILRRLTQKQEAPRLDQPMLVPPSPR